MLYSMFTSCAAMAGNAIRKINGSMGSVPSRSS